MSSLVFEGLVRSTLLQGQIFEVLT